MRFLLFIVLSLCNSLIRGGLIQFIIKSEHIAGLRYTYAALYGICFAIVSNNPIFGLAMATAMFIGSVWHLPNYALDRGHWWPHTRRGMEWALPLIAVMAYFYGLTALWYFPAFFLMFPCYYLPILYFKNNENGLIVNSYTVGEVLYGDLLCLPILFI